MADMNERDTKLVQYLNEAYGKEKELEVALQAHIGMTTRASYKRRLQQHLGETKSHGRRLEQRIRRLGGDPQTLQRLAGQATAAFKGPLHALRGSGEEEKLLKNAKTEYSEEAEEIATYTAIEAFAESVGDGESAKLAKEIRRDEERTARYLERLIPQLTKAVVRSRGSRQPAHPRENSTPSGPEAGLVHGTEVARVQVASALRLALGTSRSRAAPAPSKETWRGARPMLNQDLLDIYLRDHFAGATAGLDLAKRMSGDSPGGPLKEIAGEIESDRQILRDSMSSLDLRPSLPKTVLGWFGEKAARLKLNDRVSDDPLSAISSSGDADCGGQRQASALAGARRDRLGGPADGAARFRGPCLACRRAAFEIGRAAWTGSPQGAGGIIGVSHGT